MILPKEFSKQDNVLTLEQQRDMTPEQKKEWVMARQPASPVDNFLRLPWELWKQKGICFVHAGRWERDAKEISEAFGSPDDYYRWIVFDETNKKQDLAFGAGFFPSKARAAQNGWVGAIPESTSYGLFGKEKIPWVIINTFPHWDDDWYWSDANPLWQEYANPKDAHEGV